MKNTGSRKISPIDYGFDYSKARIDRTKILSIIDYPYLRLFETSDTIEKRFNNLQKFKCKIINEKYVIRNIDLNDKDIKFDNEYVLIIDDDAEYENIEIISDYFNEQCRVKCKFESASGTTYEYFRNYFDNIINYLERKKLIISIKNFREAIWTIGFKECSTFKPKLIKYFIEKFNARKILDISSGWGDRLIGAMASDIDCYHGFDPNHCLHQGYQDMISLFKPKGEFIIQELPFEKAILKENYYDMVMTSPPYFKMEIYSEDETQSAFNINDEKEWFDKYLKVWIEKCHLALKYKGILALNINQFKNQSYVYLLLEYMKNDQWNYLGVISHSKKKKDNPQPTFIWSNSNFV